MTMFEESGATIVASTRSEADAGSYVDWPAILVGAMVATAISILFMAFGSAIGLSLASPFDNEGASTVGLAIGLGLWLVWVQVSGFMAGGYVTGRLRRRMHDASEHESDVRDGMHGLAVWATGVVVGGLMIAAGVGGVIGAAANVAGGATQTAVEKLADAADEANPLSYAVNAAFRSEQPAQAGAVDARAEALAIVGRGVVNGDVPADDRAYLAQLIAQETGLSPEEAKARVDTTITNAQQIAEDAGNAADRARRFSVVAAFITAASLAISAAAAYWAAGMGGRHRDEETVVPFWFDRLR
jgi:hypothetical protein